MTSLDLNHTRTKRELFSRSIEQRVDAVAPLEARASAIAAIIADIEANPPVREETPRNYIGASAIGDECARKVQLDLWPTFHPAKRPPRKLPLEAKSIAIFERGHRAEPLVAEWLRAAQYDLVTEKAEGGQFGFITGDAQIRGHADGLFRNFFPSDSPRLSDIIASMALWENKCVNGKGFRAVARHGVLKQYPKYDTQVQLLMAYLELPATLFSFLNAETGELWFELTPFNQQRAQAASDRAVHILRATRAGDLLPKVSNDPSYFACRFCDFREECWPSS